MDLTCTEIVWCGCYPSRILNVARVLVCVVCVATVFSARCAALAHLCSALPSLRCAGWSGFLCVALLSSVLVWFSFGQRWSFFVRVRLFVWSEMSSAVVEFELLAGLLCLVCSDVVVLQRSRFSRRGLVRRARFFFRAGSFGVVCFGLAGWCFGVRWSVLVSSCAALVWCMLVWCVALRIGFRPVSHGPRPVRVGVVCLLFSVYGLV